VPLLCAWQHRKTGNPAQSDSTPSTPLLAARKSRSHAFGFRAVNGRNPPIINIVTRDIVHSNSEVFTSKSIKFPGKGVSANEEGTLLR
jgi:hypothetical protein